MFFNEDQEMALHKLHRNDKEYEESLDFLKGSLNEFITRELAPIAYKNDEEEVFSDEAFHKLGETGFISMPYKEELEGMELPFTYYISGLESIAKANAGFALGVAIHGTVTDGIAYFASDEMKKKYVPDLASGRKIASFCLSESDSGSDAQSMKTRYSFDSANNEYILNGSKFWITNGMSADVFFIMAKGEDGQVSSFVFDNETGSGTFEKHKIIDKMGVRGSNTAELIFSDFRIPASCLVGKEGDGFRYAMRMLNGGRVTIAGWSTGIAQGAYEKLLKYSHERQLFGKTLADLDNTKKELAQMVTEIYAARDLSYNAAFYKETDKVMKYAAIAKVKATEVAVDVSQRAIQIAGGYGFLKESKIERHLRDALLGRIGEGANELLNVVVIPRAIYKEYKQKPITMNW